MKSNRPIEEGKKAVRDSIQCLSELQTSKYAVQFCFRKPGIEQGHDPQIDPLLVDEPMCLVFQLSELQRRLCRTDMLHHVVFLSGLFHYLNRGMP